MGGPFPKGFTIFNPGENLLLGAQHFGGWGKPPSSGGGRQKRLGGTLEVFPTRGGGEDIRHPWYINSLKKGCLKTSAPTSYVGGDPPTRGGT